jgi:hypothetical protein
MAAEYTEMMKLGVKELGVGELIAHKSSQIFTN